MLGVDLISGFGRVKKGSINNLSRGFFGVLDQVPVDPRRDEGRYIDDAALRVWAEEQIKLWKNVHLNSEQMHWLAINAASYGVKAPDFANVKVNDVWMSLGEFHDALCAGEVFRFPIDSFEGGVNIVRPTIQYRMVDVDEEEVEEYENVILSSSNYGGEYWKFYKDNNTSSGFLSMLEDCFSSDKSYVLTLKFSKMPFGRYLGPDSISLDFKNGEEFVLYGLELSAAKIA